MTWTALRPLPEARQHSGEVHSRRVGGPAPLICACVGGGVGGQWCAWEIIQPVQVSVSTSIKWEQVYLPHRFEN